MRSRLMTTFAIILCTSTIAAATVNAATIDATNQHRTTFGDSNANGEVDSTQDLQQHVAPDFGRFTDVVQTATEHSGASAAVDTWQDSVIGSCALIAAGGFQAASMLEPGATFAYGQADSVYRVTFNLDEAIDFNITGDIDTLDDVRVTVNLESNGTPIINDIIENQLVQYVASGTLQPGQHTFEIHAVGIAFNMSPGSDARDAHFRLQLRICGPRQDITGDGVVDVFDLLLLLENWGACPGGPDGDCLADLDADHDVNVFDLLELLQNWGQ